MHGRGGSDKRKPRLSAGPEGTRVDVAGRVDDGGGAVRELLEDIRQAFVEIMRMEE